MALPESENSTTDQVVAFIDIGTNSARLLLVRLYPNQSFTVLSQRKEAIRLGEGEFQSELLQQEAIQRAVTVCVEFTQMAKAMGADEITAVATSAAREASNRNLLLTRLKDEAELDVRIISGREEARLIYLGIVSGFNLGERLGVFIDIGGGSTEVIVGDHSNYLFLDTLKLGAIRLSSLYLAEEVGPVSTKVYKEICSYVRDVAVRTVQAVNRYSPQVCVGSSGTIENLADIAMLRSSKRRREPDDPLTLDQLKKTTAYLRGLTLEERRQVPGINPGRADIILGGAAIIETLMKEMKINKIYISDRSLRDGLLVDRLTHSGGDFRPDGRSFREESVLRLGRSLGFDEPHSRHVAQVALALFDSAKDAGLHGLSHQDRELLYYASLLHDVGITLSYTSHHAHSYYFIKNADLLGFDQREVDIIANTAKYHRKAYPRKKHPEFAALDTYAQETVRILCVLLSIAESLDRTHLSLVRHARFRKEGDKTAALELYAQRESPLEVWGVEFQEKAFQRVFGKQLEVETYLDQLEDEP